MNIITLDKYSRSSRLENGKFYITGWQRTMGKRKKKTDFQEVEMPGIQIYPNLSLDLYHVYPSQLN